MSGTSIQLVGLRKQFGQTVAVDSIDLTIEPGNLFFLLGPSGCGKTTLLRMIAGFTEPTSGSIMFGDRNVTHLPPNKRNTGMVFQGYALWPHMTVRQNIEFGLTVGPRKGKFTAEQRRQMVDRALQRVDISQLAERKTNQLSGGQQQRVALARALVIEPDVLLLDEPLSNLDAKLRLDMRSQIKEVCKQAGITGVYVTHDQKEALSMADGIAVLHSGKIAQVGAPESLYRRPRTRFVADFLGETNFIPAQIVQKRDNQVILESAAGRLISKTYPDNLPDTGNVTCSIRPEAIRIDHNQNDLEGDQPDNTFVAHEQAVVYLGEMAQHQMVAQGEIFLKVFELNPRPIDEKKPVRVIFDAIDVVILED